MQIPFDKFLEIKELCQAKVNLLSAALNSFPKEQNGMILEKFRSHESFKKMKKDYQTQFKALREINSYGNKVFKKELKQLRTNKFHENN